MCRREIELIQKEETKKEEEENSKKKKERTPELYDPGKYYLED